MTEVATFTTNNQPKRFESKQEPIQFYVDDDLFHAAPSVPGDVMVNLVDLHESSQAENASAVEKIGVMKKIFEAVLYEDSMTLLNQRLSSREKPIDLNLLAEIMQWLIGEAIALRPTQPPSSSTESHDSIGENLTAGARQETLLPANSNGTDTST